jgi:toxin HigB-1
VPLAPPPPRELLLRNLTLIRSLVVEFPTLVQADDVLAVSRVLWPITPGAIVKAMIKGFRDRTTERIWFGEGDRRLPPEIQKVARRKLRMLNNARSLDDLRIPPANRLEALREDRAGHYSIRINRQWRICFVRGNGDADAVVVNYH